MTRPIHPPLLSLCRRAGDESVDGDGYAEQDCGDGEALSSVEDGSSGSPGPRRRPGRASHVIVRE